MSVDYRPNYDPADVDSDYGHTGGDITVPTFTANMKPFRFWCQKALPLVYDDSLSYYEVLCKVVKQMNDFLTDLQTATGAIDEFAQQFVINQQFLNEMADQLGQNIEDLETYINERMTDFMTAYTQLQDYVNNYFDNLDVQQEINNKLDEMASDGTFNDLFYPVITAWMTAKTAQIDAAIAGQDAIQAQQNGRISVLEGRMDTFASLPSGSTSGNAELLDIRTNFLGEVYPTAGEAVRASDMIASGFQSISATKLEEWDGNDESSVYDSIQIDIGGYKGGHVVVIGSFKYFQSDLNNTGSCAVYATNTPGEVEDANAVNYLPGTTNSIFTNFTQITTSISGEERLLLQFAIPDDFSYQYLKIGHFEHNPISGNYTEPLYIVYANSWSKTQVDPTLSITGDAADAKATGDALDELNERLGDTSVSFIQETEATKYGTANTINIFNNKYVIADTSIVNGVPVPEAGYSASYEIPVLPETDYCAIFYYLTTGKWRYDTGLYYAFYDYNGNVISSGNTSAGSEVITSPANASYARISFNSNRLNQYMMFGKNDALGDYVDNSWSTTFRYIPYGIFSKGRNVIISIVNPYVFYQWNGYCYFKFDSIVYHDLTTDSSKTLLYTDIKTKYPEYITASNSSKVLDCCRVLDGYYFVYSTVDNSFVIKNTIADSDILLLTHANGKMYGLLYKEYNDRIQYYYTRGVYNALSPDVLNSIDSTIDTNVMQWINDNYFIFGYVGDNHQLGKHIGVETDSTGLAIGYTDNAVSFDAILNAGDEILTVTSAGKDTLVSLRNAFKFYDADKMVISEGNHDRGTTANTVITRKEYYDTVLRRYRNDSNVHLVSNKAYYYRDYPKHKIRIVCLTPYNYPEDSQEFYPYVETAYGYDQTQMEWLCNTALQVDSDWLVIIMTHTAPVSSAEGITGNGTGGVNPLVLRSILESFKDGTNEHITFSSEVADGYFDIDLNTTFSSQGSRKIIGVFSGHTHTDSRVVINGINYISIACGYVDHVTTPTQREGLTYSAICFDVGFVIKSENRIILRRIGYGGNRAFYYA